MPANAPIIDVPVDHGPRRDGADLGASAGSEVGRPARLWRWLVGTPPVLVVGLLVLFAAFHAASYPGRTNDTPLFNSPHESTRYVLAEQWLETGEPSYRLPLYDRLPPDIAPALTPRDAGLLDDEVVPKDFAYALALVTGMRAVSPWFPAFLTTISAVALLVLTGLLGRAVVGSRAGGVLAAALLAATTPFWSAGAGLVETGAVTASLFVAGVLALVHRRRLVLGGDGVRKLWLDALAGVLLGLAVGTHYATVLLAAGVAVAFAWPRDGGSWRRFAVLVASAAAVLLPVLAFNTMVYGSPLNDGYSVGVDFLDANLGENTGGLFTLRPGLLLDHLDHYVLRWEVVVLLGLAAVGFWTDRGRGDRSAVSALGRACLIGGVPFLVFSGARPLSGVAGFLVNASLMRYLAPVAALIAVAAAAGVVALARWRAVVAGVLAGAAFAGGLHVIATSPQGPFEVREQTPSAREKVALVLRVVPADAVVITGRSDKFLWPDRSTLTAPYLVDEPPVAGDDTHLALRAPTPDRLAEVISAVSDEGLEVFLWNDGRWFNGRRRGAFPELDERLAAEGIDRLETAVPGVWRFTTSG